MGNQEVVEVLLGRDGVNINNVDNHGKINLMKVAIRKSVKITAMLLGTGKVHIDQVDNIGHKLLSMAASADRCDDHVGTRACGRHPRNYRRRHYNQE